MRGWIISTRAIFILNHLQMHKKNLLRQQIIAERKRKDRIFFLFIFFFMFFIFYGLVYDDMGIVRYLNLKEREVKLEQRIINLNSDTSALKEEIVGIEGDNFYLEKRAREEYGLSRPDEYIFKFQE